MGLLHDIDFEQYPDQHCKKAPELLRPAGVSEEMSFNSISTRWAASSRAGSQGRAAPVWPAARQR